MILMARKCSYCTETIPFGTGMMFVYKAGSIKFYCSKRCYRNDVIMRKTFNRKELRQKGKAEAVATETASAK